MVDHFIKLTQVIKPFWCGKDGSNRLFRNRERIRARKRAAGAFDEHGKGGGKEANEKDDG